MSFLGKYSKKAHLFSESSLPVYNIWLMFSEGAVSILIIVFSLSRNILVSHALPQP